MNNKRAVAAIIGVVVILALSFLIVMFSKSRVSQVATKEVGMNTQPPVVVEPTRTDFGTNVPSDFLPKIPLETGAKIVQSYSLNYVGQKQLTIVFLSTRTVKENYTIYENFLKREKWSISNKYESPSLSSLYGTKEGNDINVTISEAKSSTSARSQVSISFLKK